MKKIKVLHLISTDVFSGAENVACQIIKKFENNENYEMVYCSKLGKNEERLNNLGINLLPIKKFDYFSVKKAIKEYNPDVVHAHDIKASIMAAIICDDKIKIISHVHCNHENMRKKNMKTLLFNYFSKKYSKIIWVSQSAFDNYIYSDRVKDKSIVLYNVIDKNGIFNAIKNDKENYGTFDIIYLGRLTYAKYPERLINIIKQIKDKGYNIKAAVVGTGELYDDIKELIHKFKLDKNVKLFGYVTNPYKILNSSKILVMTSRYEGTPMVALEAMALGKPIISTPTDGMVDIIDNEKNGFLSNSDFELVNKIIEILNDEEKYLSMSNYVKHKSDEVNNIQIYCEKMRKIYEK